MHIGIIPDGNRRYAIKKGLSPEHGHAIGLANLEAIIGKYANNTITELSEVDTLTIYLCSEDNLTKRPQLQTEALYILFRRVFKEYLKPDSIIHKNKINIKIIGNKALFPEDIQSLLSAIERETSSYIDKTMYLLCGYDGPKHIRTIIKDRIIEPVTNPDLVIRTGNETRTSGFLPYHTMYSEWFFLDKMFPEFTIKDLLAIIAEYKGRNRRYGK